MNGNLFADADGDDVLITSGDVTSIGETASADAVASGGPVIAASLSPGQDVLNVAFVTGSGGVQIIQIVVAELTQGDGDVSGGDVIVTAELTALSSEAISVGRGEATCAGTTAVAANLSEHGQLILSFVDVEGHVQLIETNIAGLVRP